MDYEAIWALIENILLAATAEEVGSIVHIPVGKERGIKAFAKVPENFICPVVLLSEWSNSFRKGRCQPS